VPDFKDYYQILGVARDASPDTVQKAYKKLARKLHPDVNKEAGAEDRFKELGEAYEVLKDKDKRAKYDRFGAAWQQAQRHTGGAPPGWENVRVEYGPGFESDFGSVGGDDPFAHLFEQLFGGGGTGGGPAGDLFLKIAVAPHPRFRLEGGDLHVEVPIAPWTAALGGEADVPTLDGRQRVRVPAGTSSGRRIRLAGKGFPAAAGKAGGDLYAELTIAVPKTLTDRERELYEELATISDFEPGREG
jgi:curved DNA-binding protein